MKKKTLKSVNKKQSDKDYTDLHKKLCCGIILIIKGSFWVTANINITIHAENLGWLVV